MLLSIAYVLVVGTATEWLYRKLHLPSLAGTILTGIVLGPYILGLIDGSILGISAELREIALIIILMRAGLPLDVDDLKRVERPAILMYFMPTCSEIVGIMALAPRLLGISMLEAAIMGSVVVAVSSAVVVPRMIRLMEEGHGTENSIPQLILTSASVDDVFVIVLFSASTNLVQSTQVSAANFVQIPLSILAGVLIGAAMGILLTVCFKKIHIRDTVKVIILLCIPFVLVSLEDSLKGVFSFSSLIFVMCMGIALQKEREPVARRLPLKFNKLWAGAEILLSVLMGATVDIGCAAAAGGAVVLLILGVLVFHMARVMCCLVGTKLNLKERMFCMAAYMSETAVQAAIGGVPLPMGLTYGNIVLTVAVLAILITVPLGAFLVDFAHRRWLAQEY